MLSYERFKEVVAENFKDHLPEEFHDAEVMVTPVKKVNQTLDTLVIHRPNASISPVLYLQQMYEDYVNTGDLFQVLRKTAANFMKALMDAADEKSEIRHIAASIGDVEYIKNHVVLQLINTEMNRELLKDVPHKDFLDLSIVYRVVILLNHRFISSTLVTHECAKRLGLTEEQLYELAEKNSRRRMPPVVKDLNEVLLEEILPQDEETAAEMAGIVEDMQNNPSHDPSMYVISNAYKINGASSLLYEDVLHELAERLDSNLYILPSSIHEVLALPTKNNSPDALAVMVQEVNAGHVHPQEQLSYHVYLYDKALREVTVIME